MSTIEHNIFLVRHGESQKNAHIRTNEILPDHDIKLTTKGRLQANTAGGFLETYLKNHNLDTSTFRMWVSPYTRTRQTAEIINQYLKISDVKEDAMLVELQFGLFQYHTSEECKQLFPTEYEQFQLMKTFNGKYYARRPGGESPFDCEIRQKIFIDTILRDFSKKSEPKNLIIVGHGAALNTFRKALFIYSHEWYEKEENPSNCSIQKIEMYTSKNIDAGYIHGYSIARNV